MWQKLSKLLGREGPAHKKEYLLLLFIGILLLGCSNLFMKKDTASAREEPETVPVAAFGQESREEVLADRLAGLLSKVEGAGAVEVMVTLRYGEAKVIAEDVKTSEKYTVSGEEQGTETSVENKVVLLEDKDGSTTPLILKEAEAEVEGVLIVAQGGEDILVKEALSRAAQALLGVPAHKVEVLKMK